MPFHDTTMTAGSMFDLSTGRPKRAGDVAKQYKAMLKKTQQEAMEEAIKQAQINEGMRQRSSEYFIPGLGGNESASAVIARANEIRQRKAAGVGGTLKILANLAKGETATLAKGDDENGAGEAARLNKKYMEADEQVIDEDGNVVWKSSLYPGAGGFRGYGARRI